MPENRTVMIVALCAGFLASGIAFVSGAGAGEAHSAGGPVRVATAVFAGGCAACLEDDLDRIEGVIDAVAGQARGRVVPGRPAGGPAGIEPLFNRPVEAVRVTYDPAIITYPELAAGFLRLIDPTDPGGQFCDRGEAYHSAMFVSGRSQQADAHSALETAARMLGRPVVTHIRAEASFRPSALHLQDLAVRKPAEYRQRREFCGRDQRLAQLWPDRSWLGN